MSRKSQECYINAFELLAEIAENFDLVLNPPYVLTDFEKAAINAIKEVFPESKISGCFFHWTQNLIKKTGRFGTQKILFVRHKHLYGYKKASSSIVLTTRKDPTGI